MTISYQLHSAITPYDLESDQVDKVQQFQPEIWILCPNEPYQRRILATAFFFGPKKLNTHLSRKVEFGFSPSIHIIIVGLPLAIFLTGDSL